MLQRVKGWLVKVVIWVVVLSVLALLGWATYAMLDLDILHNTVRSSFPSLPLVFESSVFIVITGECYVCFSNIILIFLGTNS